MVRRTREFDRSAFFGDLFYNVVPHNQVHMSTGDEWRGHRRLMHDTMSSGFLHDVAGPQIYSTALAMLDLWRQKMRLAAGHPFSAATDVPKGTLDVIWAVTFGSEAGTTKKQFEYLSGVDKIERADEDDKDAAVDFPTVTDPETFTAIITLTGSVEIPMKSPFPRIHHSLAMRFMPRLVAAMKAKDRLITHHLQDSWRKFQGQADEEESAGGGGRVKSAMDLVVQREAIMAQKENRPARYDTPAIRDEMFGFLVAGYDTTSSTICWGLKFLATYQPVQQKLRAELRAAFTRARDAGDKPTVEDIVKSNIPYLDATLEEIHRCGGTASSAIRRTTEDTVILGHRVPKDTDVFMVSNIELHSTFRSALWATLADKHVSQKRWSTAQASWTYPSQSTKASAARAAETAKTRMACGTLPTSAPSSPSAGWSRTRRAAAWNSTPEPVPLCPSAQAHVDALVRFLYPSRPHPQLCPQSCSVEAFVQHL